MRKKKTNTVTTCFLTFFQGSISLLRTPIQPPPDEQHRGMGSYGQYIVLCLCHFSSHFSPAQVWALYKLLRLQEISMCCSMGSSPGCRGISALVPRAPPPLPPLTAVPATVSQSCHSLLVCLWGAFALF